MQLTLHSLACHRNGIHGAPFHVALFDDTGPEGSRKVGIVFENPAHVAVLDVGKLAAGNIRFGENAWRGDWYEPSLRRIIRDANAENRSPQQLIRLLLDEIETLDDLGFSSEQLDFLERRLAELLFALDGEVQS